MRLILGLLLLILLLQTEATTSEEKLGEFSDGLVQSLQRLEQISGLESAQSSINDQIKFVNRKSLSLEHFIQLHDSQSGSIKAILSKAREYVRKVAASISKEISNSTLVHAPCSTIDGKSWEEARIAFDEASSPKITRFPKELGVLVRGRTGSKWTEDHSVHIAEEVQISSPTGAVGVCRSLSSIESVSLLLKEDKDRHAFNSLYFGHISGITRWWPGVFWRTTNASTEYDPRERPWYVSAISSPKAFYVMLDVSTTMASASLLGDGSSRLEDAIDGVEALVNTLDARSTLAIILFNETVTVSPLTELGSAPPMNPRNKFAIRRFLSERIVSGGSSDMGAAMLKAERIAESRTSAKACENVFLLITDGVPTLADSQRDKQVLTAATESLVWNLTQPGRMHVFSVGPGRDDHLLRGIVCSGRGFRVQVKKGESLRKSLLDLHFYEKWTIPADSAKALMNSTGDAADDFVLTPLYLDALGSGLLVSASKAVYSSSGQLIGVAAVDVSLEYIRQAIAETARSMLSFNFLIDNAGRIAYYPLSLLDASSETYEDTTLIALERLRLSSDSLVQFKSKIEAAIRALSVNGTDMWTEHMVLERAVPRLDWSGDRRGVVTRKSNVTAIGAAISIHGSTTSTSLLFFDVFDEYDNVEPIDWYKNNTFNCSRQVANLHDSTSSELYSCSMSEAIVRSLMPLMPRISSIDAISGAAVFHLNSDGVVFIDKKLTNSLAGTGLTAGISICERGFGRRSECPLSSLEVSCPWKGTRAVGHFKSGTQVRDTFLLTNDEAGHLVWGLAVNLERVGLTLLNSFSSAYPSWRDKAVAAIALDGTVLSVWHGSEEMVGSNIVYDELAFLNDASALCLGRYLLECSVLEIVRDPFESMLNMTGCSAAADFHAGGLGWKFSVNSTGMKCQSTLSVILVEEYGIVLVVGSPDSVSPTCPAGTELRLDEADGPSEDALFSTAVEECSASIYSDETELDQGIRLLTGSVCFASKAEEVLLYSILLGTFLLGFLFLLARHVRFIPLHDNKIIPENSHRDKLKVRYSKVSLATFIKLKLLGTSSAFALRIFWEATSSPLPKEELRYLCAVAENDRDQDIFNLVIQGVDNEIDKAFEEALVGRKRRKEETIIQQRRKSIARGLEPDDVLRAIANQNSRANGSSILNGVAPGMDRTSWGPEGARESMLLKPPTMLKLRSESEELFEELRGDLVRVFLNDAIRGNTPRTYRLSGLALKLYWAQQARLYQLFHGLIVFINIFLLFFEVPSSSQPTPTLHSSWFFGAEGASAVFFLLAVETVCVVAHLVDLALSLTNFGLRRFSLSLFGGLHVMLVCSMFIDVLMAWVLGCSWKACAISFNGYPRFSRPLRGFLLLNMARGVREELFKLARIIPKLLDVSILLAYILAIFSLFFTAIFASRVQSSPYGIPDFSSFSESMSTLYVFISGPGAFSRVVAVTAGEDRGLILLVLAVYIIGALYLFSNITAVTLDSYGEVSREIHMKKVVVHRKCLFAAFRIFTRAPSSQSAVHRDDMDKTEWGQIVRIIQPSTDSLDAEALFELADEDLSGSISPLEFVEIFDVLRSKSVIRNYTRWENFLRSLSSKQSWFWKETRVGRFLYRIHRVVGKFLAAPIYSEFIVLSIILYGLVLVLDLEFSGATSVGGLSLSAHSRFTVLYSVQATLVALMFLEVFFHLVGKGLRSFASDRMSVFDVVVLIAAIIVLVPFGESALFGGALVTDSVTEELFLVRQSLGMFVSVRTLKLILTIGRYQRFLRASYYAIPGVLRAVALMLMMFYLFVATWIELLAGRYRRLVEGHPNFNSAGEALILSWQLLVGAEWGDVMREAERSSGRAVRIMFIIFNLLAAKILLNVLVSVFFRSFERVKQIEKLNNKREECKVQLQAIKERHRPVKKSPRKDSSTVGSSPCDHAMSESPATQETMRRLSVPSSLPNRLPPIPQTVRNSISIPDLQQS